MLREDKVYNVITDGKVGLGDIPCVPRALTDKPPSLLLSLSLTLLLSPLSRELFFEKL